jgi:BMFP domain-containing protein YqiC
VSQLESTLAKEHSERADLMQRIEQLEARDEAHLQHFAEQEKALCVQVGVKEK